MIAGASAGGYTALAAAARTTTFAAATARSAIIDPLHWQQNTTSLQRHHAGSLVGPDGELDRGPRERTPCTGVAHTRGRDSVVPPDDVLQLEQELRRRDRPCTLLVPAWRRGTQSVAPGISSQALEAEAPINYLAVLDPTRIGRLGGSMTGHRLCSLLHLSGAVISQQASDLRKGSCSEAA